jgi:two-component system OmpR family response regulator
LARILVVDDERTVLTVLSTLLGRMGHQCLSTTSAFEALAVADRYRPELLVVDVTMPEMTGEALVRELRVRTGDHCPPVVFVSGYAECDVEPTPDLRMRFVTKPFGMADLAEAVGALLPT